MNATITTGLLLLFIIIWIIRWIISTGIHCYREVQTILLILLLFVFEYQLRFFTYNNFEFEIIIFYDFINLLAVYFNDGNCLSIGMHSKNLCFYRKPCMFVTQNAIQTCGKVTFIFIAITLSSRRTLRAIR